MVSRRKFFPTFAGNQAPNTLIILVPTIRLERMTYRLQGGCSTN
jgi:hypothetical protein